MIDYINYSEKRKLLESGELSLVQNVETFLQNIEKAKHLNAFNFVFDDAVESAGKIQNKISKKTAGKLAGMVIAIKDIIAIKEKPLTCSSKILNNFTSIYSATAIEKLINEDAIIIGKTNCDEFAMGSSNENSAFGPVLNPIDEQRVPGGSSGGSAAAVAAKLCDAALGSDTGGSIRQPACFTGVFGLKPTYGRVSRFGLTAFASSFDTIGPLANNTEDIAKILEVISGWDQKDSTSQKLNDEQNRNFIKDDVKFKIGIPKEYFTDALNSEVNLQIQEIIEQLKKSNFAIKEISLPHTDYNIATYYILITAEASSNLSRYDGAEYGYRSSESSSLSKMYINSRYEGFGDEVKRRIMLGTYVLSAGYYDAYYRKAQKVRRLIKEDFDKAFNKVDIILTPTSPFTAFKLGEKLEDPLQMYLSDIYTTSTNLAGIPAINIPIGNSSNGLPIGMQLISNHFAEDKILSLSNYIEKYFLQ